MHVHSEYSLLDGLSKIDQLVQRAVELKMPALALTDHGAMYGAIPFYNACKKAGIKPIIGLEAYIAQKSRFDKQVKMGSDASHLTLLAKNFVGYRNLMKLTSRAHLEGFSYRPRIDDEILYEHREGLIATTGCLQSRFSKLLRDDKIDELKELMKKYYEWFEGNFYVEIQHHDGYEEVQRHAEAMIKLSRQVGIPLVATNDVHYVMPEHAAAQDALLCVSTRSFVKDTDRMTMMDSQTFYLRSEEEMRSLFGKNEDALENTLKIANDIDIDIPLGKWVLPAFPLPKGINAESALREMAHEKLPSVLDEITPDIEKRLEYELDVITGKGYATYFLIVQDFVQWAKQQGIAVGPGRGSAAGSLVSYALGITTIDPLEHDLKFERFLNPERPSPPDIDMDFADSRREEVVAYVTQKYGEQAVANVITFGRMEARVAIRDIGRVLQHTYGDCDRIAKLVPVGMGLAEAIKTVPELASYAQLEKYKSLFDLALVVEGNVRHTSVHAAAIIISDGDITNYAPVQRESKEGKIITQYDMYALDANVSGDKAVGLMKFDFLGLRNLTILQEAIILIKQQHNIEIDLDRVPIDDKDVFEMLGRGETTGVFQLESAGMRRVARQLKPNKFSDITAMVALYRPGPMDLIPGFIEAKHDPKKVHYPHPDLKDIFAETYGYLVYQEQALSVANVMAGYSLGEADVLRKAIGKKNIEIMQAQQKEFIERSVKKGYNRTIATEVWNYIEKFAGYGFNKAHAASYAMLAYRTAYLKVKYPVEYMAALASVESLSHSQKKEEKVRLVIEEARQMGIKVLPPSINHSREGFTLEKHAESKNGWAIRFGFGAIKNVGTAAISAILSERDAHGLFANVTDFLQRVDARKVNKKVIECLAMVGSFDAFTTRSSILTNLEEIRTQASQFQSEVDGQDSLFGGQAKKHVEDTFVRLDEFPRAELLSYEKELFGFYLTQHPMVDALDAVTQQAQYEISELDTDIHLKKSVQIGGLITEVKELRTKKGDPMAVGVLQDNSGEVRWVCFPRAFVAVGKDLIVDSVVLMKGEVDTRDDELQILVEKITKPATSNQQKEDDSEAVEIDLPRATDPSVLAKLGSVLRKTPGSTQLVFIIPAIDEASEPTRLPLPYKVEWNKKLADFVQATLAKK